MLRGLKHVVMVVPVNTQVDKAEDVAQKDRNQGPQRSQVAAVTGPELQHHDCDDDRKHAIAERFKTSLWHDPSSHEERAPSNGSRLSWGRLARRAQCR